jgi:hypothetical protein
MVDAPKADAPKPPLKKAPDDYLDGDKPKKFSKPAGTGKHLGRGILIASVIVTFGWVFASLTQPRFQLVSVQTDDNTFVYRLDQRTGVVHFCTSQACTALKVTD